MSFFGLTRKTTKNAKWQQARELAQKELEAMGLPGEDEEGFVRCYTCYPLDMYDYAPKRSLIPFYNNDSLINDVATHIMKKHPHVLK